jgi:hypothetical protein
VSRVSIAAVIGVATAFLYGPIYDAEVRKSLDRQNREVTAMRRSCTARWNCGPTVVLIRARAFADAGERRMCLDAARHLARV